ncbi:MAG: extracellular solute-binding protein, partial [Spirochaetota bacterium]
MKKLIILFLCMVVATGLFATGVKEAPSAKAAITISVPWAGKELDQFLPVLKAFEEKENVSVKYLTYRGEDLSSILPAQFEAGQALADIIFMWDWWVKKNSKYAVDLTDIWSPQ